jgi:quercetin dioxygenase-like cupin family protein
MKESIGFFATKPIFSRAVLKTNIAGPIVLGLLLSAQAPRGISPGAIPIEQEPQHKVVLKNDFVRIIDATLPPGYVTKDHIHAADSVSVNVANGREGEAGQRGLGRAGFSRGGYSHVVSNTNPAIVRYIVVEPFKTDRPGAEAATLPNHILETENDRVRVYRVRLGAGESMESHTHASGRVLVSVAGPDGAGKWFWVGGGENHPLKAAGGAALEIVEVEPL